MIELYTNLATKITNKLAEWDVIESDKFEIYAYSFEILISYSVYFIVYLLISLLTHTLFESLCFLIGFCTLRHFAGGYHTSTYLRCHLLFSFTHFIFIILYKSAPPSRYLITIGSLILYILLSVFIFAPVDNENKPFTDREFIRFRFESRVYVSMISIILIIGFALFSILRPYIFSFILGTAFAATSVWVAKVICKLSNRKTNSQILNNQKKGDST